MTAFGATSTTGEVLGGRDLTGRRVLVTGASAGLGVETIRSLAAHGATVVGVARDPAKADGAVAAAGVAGDVVVRQGDLADLASVRACTPHRRDDRGPAGRPPGPALQWKTIPQGAATTVWAGVVADADAVGGRYCEDCAVSPVVAGPAEVPGVFADALDPAAAALWTQSEALVARPSNRERARAAGRSPVTVLARGLRPRTPSPSGSLALARPAGHP